MKLSIVIPCYNEEKNIPLIFNDLEKLEINPKEVEFIFVDNGSDDNSAKLLLKLSAKHDFTRIVIVKDNRGYGLGILSGLEKCKGDFIGWMHADMQVGIASIVKAYQILQGLNFDENLYIKGTRKGRPWLDIFFTCGMSIFESLLMGSFFSDINSQPNIMHRSSYKKWKNPPHDYLLDLYALYEAKRQKLQINRFKVRYKRRVHGKSSWNTGFVSRWNLIKRVISFSIKLKSRPL